MQKIKFINANGDEIDFTSGCYGVTGWKGLSNANLNLQTQKVPNHDGSVYIDGLLENREIELNLVINDGNNLQTRYEKRQELCKKLNPKLGEGYLYYENDSVQRRIKAISETPIIENKNADESGSVKATLVFDCTGVYWEDLEETVVTLKSFEKKTIVNNGDVPCSVKVEADSWGSPTFSIKNDSDQKIDLKDVEEFDRLSIDTNFGQKRVTGARLSWDIGGYGSTNEVVCYGKDKLIVAGSDTTLISDDGISYNLVKTTFTDAKDIVYSKRLNLFVILRGGGVLTSPDGINWESQSSGITTNLTGITYSEDLGLFVIVGGRGTSRCILTSPDGINWTVRINETSGSTRLNSVYYGHGRFVAVGNQIILCSTNGITWEVIGNASEVATTMLNRVFYNDNLDLFVIVGNSGTILISSSSGVFWTSSVSGVSVNLNNIFYSENLGLFMVVGNSGIILTSSDGINWESQSSGITTNLTGITYSEDLGLFVIVGSNKILTSINGITFLERDKYEVFGGSNKIIYSEHLDLFVAVKSGGHIYTSPDGINWTRQISGTSNSLANITYSEELNLFVAVGDSGTILTSPDGINWTSRESGTNYTLYGITYSEDVGLFVAVGDWNVILTSPDGINWTSRESGFSEQNVFYTIAYSKKINLFVIGGPYRDNVILTSSDGINWVINELSYGFELSNSRDMMYSEDLDLFISVGSKIAISPDGINWIARLYDSGITYYGITYSEDLDLFVAIGESGHIAISSDGINWGHHNIEPFFNLYCGVYSKYSNEFIISGYSGSTLHSNIENKTNIINRLTQDSDMTFNLKKGENNLLIYNTKGVINSKLTYRQRYLGV